jgi:hypothetical protein
MAKIIPIAEHYHPADGVFCERRKCGPYPLLHLPEVQSGMETRTLRIYTSSLTSPHLSPKSANISCFSYRCRERPYSCTLAILLISAI